MVTKSKKKTSKFDTAQVQQNVQRQFRNLDFNDPSSWPLLPRLVMCLVVAVGVTIGSWFLKLNSFQEELETERSTEQSLREDYQKKLSKAISLELLKEQREQVQRYVVQMEKQLPSKAEMSALLTDINNAGVGRGLQFDLFRPGQVEVKDYYAELPIAIRIVGKFHDIGAFSSDVAKLSRIVTLNNLNITPRSNDGGVLVMNATARTFRYLDAGEIQQQQANN